MNHHLGESRREFSASEFFIVIFIAFGLSIVTSVAAILSTRQEADLVAFDDMHLWSLTIYQVIAGAAVYLVLRHAKWQWRDFHVHYSGAGTVAGCLLAAIAIALMMGADWAVALVSGPTTLPAPTASLVAVLVVSLLNPWFEELLVLAFVIESLRKRFGLNTAINVSIALRISYHLYQGPAAFIVFAVFGVLVTLFYVRTGRLWPVIVAHAVLDFVALAGIV